METFSGYEHRTAFLMELSPKISLYLPVIHPTSFSFRFPIVTLEVGGPRVRHVCRYQELWKKKGPGPQSGWLIPYRAQEAGLTEGRHLIKQLHNYYNYFTMI